MSADTQPSLKHRFEYRLLRIASGLVRALPYRGALTLGWCVAAIGFHVVRWRRSEAERRIRQVFPEHYSTSEVRRIAWLSFRDLVFHAVELLYAARIDQAWLDRHTNMHECWTDLSGRLREGKGALVAVIHMGNWDAPAIALDKLGVPILMIARDQKNPLANEFLNRTRKMQTGVVVERSDRDLLSKVARWLQDGKIVAILIDLRSTTNAATFRFLDHDIHMGRGVGLIARQSGAPVVPVITRREGWSTHRWTLRESIYPDPALDRKSDSIRITEACLRIFEQVIRETPEQYFWHNKKWLFPGRKDRKV